MSSRFFGALVVFVLVLQLINADLPQYEIEHGNWHSLGQQAKSRIHSYWQVSPTIARLHTLLHQTSVATAFQKLWSGHRVQFPRIAQEMEDVALGADLPVHELALYSFKNELLALDGSSQVDECSDVLLHKEPVSVNGHNEDGEKELLNTSYWIQTDNFQSFGYPGLIPGGAFGFNRHGLTLTVNALHPTVPDLDSGCVGKYWMARQVLEAESIENAIQMLRNSCHTFGISLNIGSVVSGQLVNVEIAPGNVTSVHDISSGSYFHANAYRHLNVTAKRSTSSIHRLARASQLMPAKTSEDIRRILGDEKDVKYPLYCGQDNPTCLADYAATLATGLFDLRSGNLQVWSGTNPLTSHPLFKRNLMVVQNGALSV